MKEMILFGCHVVTVDEDMFDFLSQWKWSFDGRYAYRREAISRENGKNKYKKVYMQKVVNNTPDGMDTDHINRNKLDNRKSNLRSATRGQNNANRPKILKKCESRFKGVALDKRNGIWRAEIKDNGVRKYLGVFKTEEDAAIAYNEAAKQIFGEFAILN